MDSATHNAIVNFVRGIADDVLRDHKARTVPRQLKSGFVDAPGRSRIPPFRDS